MPHPLLIAGRTPNCNSNGGRISLRLCPAAAHPAARTLALSEHSVGVAPILAILPAEAHPAARTLTLGKRSFGVAPILAILPAEAHPAARTLALGKRSVGVAPILATLPTGARFSVSMAHSLKAKAYGRDDQVTGSGISVVSSSGNGADMGAGGGSGSQNAGAGGGSGSHNGGAGGGSGGGDQNPGSWWWILLLGLIGTVRKIVTWKNLVEGIPLFVIVFLYWKVFWCPNDETPEAKERWERMKRYMDVCFPGSKALKGLLSGK